MKSIALRGILACLIAAAVPAAGQQATVWVSGTETGPEFIDDTGVGLVTIYVLVDRMTEMSGVSFMATVPDCFAGATYVGENPQFPGVTGNSQTGVTIPFGQCLTAAPGTFMLAMSIQLLVTSPVTECCWYPVLPNFASVLGEVEVIDCTGNPVAARGATTIVGQGFPPQVRDSYPAPGATGVALDASLIWSIDWCSMGLGVGWTDVYFGTTADPPLVGPNHPGLMWKPSPMLPETTYYWKLRVVDTDVPGGVTETPLWNFTTTTVTPVRTSTWGTIKALYRTD